MNKKKIQRLFDIIKNPKLDKDEKNRQAKEVLKAIANKKANWEWNNFDSNFDITDEKGATLCYLTIIQGHVDIFRMLLEVGANPNTPHKITGVTPLTYAAEEGHIDIVRWLLEAKANPDLPNLILKLRPIDLAVKEGHLKIAQWLVEAGVSPELPNPETCITPLASAAEEGHTDIAQWLIGIIPELDSHNFKTGERPLSLAIKKGHLDIARLLLEAYVDPNLPNFIFGERLLPWAAEKGDINTVQLLLKYRADYDLPNVNTGDTALICAAREGHREVAKVLIDDNANLEILNRKDRKALDEATENKKLVTVALLLSHGSYIRFEKILFNFLILDIRDERDPDQRDPDLLVSLAKLARLYNPFNDLGDFEEKFKEAYIYYKKLKTLTAIHQKETFNAVDEGTNKTIPTTVLKIITGYDAPLQHPRVRFFKPAEINELLPKKEEEKKQDSCLAAKPEVNLLSRKSICRFM